LSDLASRVQQAAKPRIAIVSVLYRKSQTIEAFLDHIIRQSYAAEITVVLVDDDSPEDDVERAKAYEVGLQAAGISNRKIIIVRNRQNLGNCASRLAGLAAYAADI